MIALKQGVSVRGLRPEILLALVAANAVYNRYSADCVVTSGTDGKHAHRSFHYSGLAVDLRSSVLDGAAKHQAAEEIGRALGMNYQVILEDASGPNEHIHVEFDDGGELPRSIEERLKV